MYLLLMYVGNKYETTSFYFLAFHLKTAKYFCSFDYLCERSVPVPDKDLRIESLA